MSHKILAPTKLDTCLGSKASKQFVNYVNKLILRNDGEIVTYRPWNDDSSLTLALNTTTIMQTFLEENMSFSSGGDSQVIGVSGINPNPEEDITFSSGDSQSTGVSTIRSTMTAVKYPSFGPLICIPTTTSQTTNAVKVIATSAPQTTTATVKVIPTTQITLNQRAASIRVTSSGNSFSPTIPTNQTGSRSLLSKPNPLLSSNKNNQTIVVADSSGVIRSVPAPIVMGGGVQKKQIFTSNNSIGNLGNQVSLLNLKSHKYFSTIFKNKKSVEETTETNHQEEQNVLLVSGSNSIPVNQSLTYILPKNQKAVPQSLVYTQVSGSQTKRPLLLMTDAPLQAKSNISLVQSGNFSASITPKQESVIVSKVQSTVAPARVPVVTGKTITLQKDAESPTETSFAAKTDIQSQDQIVQKLKSGKFSVPRNGNNYKNTSNPLLLKCKKQDESFGRLQATSLGQIVSSNPSAGSVTNFQITNGQILAEKVSRPHMLSLLCDSYKIEVVKQGSSEKSDSQVENDKVVETEIETPQESSALPEVSVLEASKPVEDQTPKTEFVTARHNRRKQELAVKQDTVQISLPKEAEVNEIKEEPAETVEAEKEEVKPENTEVKEKIGETVIKQEMEDFESIESESLDFKEEIKETETTQIPSFNENSDAEKENKNTKDSSELEKFDPTKYLEWSGNIGSLPLSDLKFRLNEFGLIEVVEEDEDEGKVSSKSSVVSDAEKSDNKKKSKNTRSAEEILRCHSCGTYGMGCEFVSSRFCSVACSKAHEEEKAQSAKKLWLKEEKKLKLKQQKSLLFQQRAKLEELGLHEAKVTIEEKIKMLRMERELMKTSAGDSDVESYSGTFSGTEKLRSSTKGSFSWARYLTMLKAKSAPYTLFKDPFPTAKNNFKVGMKLEGIDPVHPSLFCVLTVAAVRGYRIKLHFDGYSDCHDFWVNANSSDIFHAGWCERTNHKLSAPKGHEKNFNWGNYLRLTRTVAAPKSCFVNNQERPIIPSGFRTGMKLEAVDKKNSSLVCVATIADVLDNRILVHFDSWDDIYDYWVDCTSPYIHPVGWCRENGHQLTPPNDYKSPSLFSWDLYLRETKSLPAPARAFKPRTTTDFRRGMKLECVDKRNPILIRVATIVDIVVQQIKIKFDGWPDQYAYWLDDDSPDIHPAGWCQKTGHPLEPPPSEEDIKNTSLCPTPGCRGIGHVKGKHPVHHMILSCPYSSMNYLRDDHISDRFCSKREYYEVKETSASKGTKPRPGIPRKKIDATMSPLPKPENRGRKRKTDTPPPPKKKSRGDSVLGDQVETGTRSEQPLWAKNRWDISETVASIGSNPLCWTPSQVAVFVENINNSPEKGKLFSEHQIDGEALLMLSQNDLVQILGFKLGPAIKLYKSIVLLREKALEIKNGISS